MNPLQKLTAQAIVNIFETGHIAGDYGSVTLLKGDAGHLTYGRSQTTLSSGNLYLLIQAYCDRPEALFAADFRPYLAGLAACDVALDTDMTLRDTLREAGHNDPAMKEAQDRFFDSQYFDPAVRTATARGIATPLGTAIVYDSFIQGGFRRIVAMVGSEIGPGGVDEHQWIQKYIDARRAWLSSLAAPLPTTVYRMDAFNKLVGDGAWDLPLSLTVRGSFISEETLKNTGPVIRASAVDANDPPASRILRLTTPYLRGEEVRRLQIALNTAGLTNSADGVYGPFTEALVKKFQLSKTLKSDGIVGPATLTALGL
ncbi:MAG TPA: peptidoglycan-binding protein [Bryobacteraceae bacterium]|nr:peptidoglycan-binding protein [Bryobacteraceae bacterium]